MIRLLDSIFWLAVITAVAIVSAKVIVTVL